MNYKLNSNSLDNLLEGFQLISFDWKYLFVNDTVVKQAKCKNKAELLDKTMMACFPGIENTPMFKKLEQCMATRTHALLLNEFTFPDNSIGWFELRIEPVPEGLFILSLDVTERRRAEMEKDKYIQGMEDMLFMTSHKVRQPIVNIMGMSNMLNTKDNSQEELIKITDYMRESVDNLDKFTRELTEYIVDMKRKAGLPRDAS